METTTEEVKESVGRTPVGKRTEWRSRSSMLYLLGTRKSETVHPPLVTTVRRFLSLQTKIGTAILIFMPLMESMSAASNSG